MIQCFADEEVKKNYCSCIGNRKLLRRSFTLLEKLLVGVEINE